MKSREQQDQMTWEDLEHYIRQKWPNLWSEIEGWEFPQIQERLDQLTLTQDSDKLNLEVAVARWYRLLERMYQLNGNILF